MTLGRKQTIPDPAWWRRAIAQAAELADRATFGELVDRTIANIRREAKGRRVGYGWSGGKDSQALRWLMEQAGVDSAVLGLTMGLEWPAMLRWQTDNLPVGCDIIAAPLDLAWLRAHPHMLFPQGRHGAAWFGIVQHRAQRTFFHREGLDLLALGRRRKDGNYIGPAGADRYTDADGVIRWAPLADWTHEQVFALLGLEQLPLPPCYDWPRGFQVGTGAWPARQWTRDWDHGFEECWTIDPDVIRASAAELPAAASWMTRTGRT